MFPLADVMVLAVLLRLWTGGGSRGWAYSLLGIGCMAMLASDTAAGLTPFITGSYEPAASVTSATSSSRSPLAPPDSTARCRASRCQAGAAGPG